MQKIRNPVPNFLDARGVLMDGGYIYVGIANGDPKVDPIDLFWDIALTIPATQPLRTLGSYIVNVITPASVFCDEADYSMRTEDNNNSLVFYSPSVYTDADSFQPASAELDELADMTSTPFGRSLLELPDAPSLATATGIPAPIPLVGSTAITGSLGRQGAGAYSYWNDPAMTSARKFWKEIGAADPDTLPGDTVYTLAAP